MYYGKILGMPLRCNSGAASGDPINFMIFGYMVLQLFGFLDVSVAVVTTTSKNLVLHHLPGS